MAGRLRPGAFLVALTLLALALRLWSLESVPPGLDTDEASIGYNAYAILRTGRDEHGARFPLAFQAFGEFKRPLYIYATVPAVALLGLTPLAVRLPAALAGALAVPALYAVGWQLLRGRRRALCAAGLLAISPWHLQFSRAAREVSLLVLALLILVAALVGALRCRHDGGATRPGLLLLAAVGAALAALYSYPGGVVLVPLLTLLILVLYRRRLTRAPRPWVAGAAAVLLLGSLPLAQQLADGRARARFAATSILSDPSFGNLVARRQARDRADGALPLLAEPLALWSGQVVVGYLSHFDPTFLFASGDPEARHRSVTGGQLHLWDLPLLLAGGFVAARGWRRPGVQVVIGWLAIGAVPAAVALPAPHAVRSIAMLPAWYLLAALGVPPFWRWVKGHRLAADWILALVLSVGLYLYGYHRYYALEEDRAWSSGWLESFRVAQAEVAAGRFARVVIPHTLPAPQVGYIYALFATTYDPQAYLAQGGSRTDRDWPGYPLPGPLSFSPFELRDVDWSAEAYRPGALESLYVYPPDERLPDGARTVAVVGGASGRPVLRLIAFSGGVPAGGP